MCRFQTVFVFLYIRNWLFDRLLWISLHYKSFNVKDLFEFDSELISGIYEIRSWLGMGEVI